MLAKHPNKTLPQDAQQDTPTGRPENVPMGCKQSAKNDAQKNNEQKSSLATLYAGYVRVMM